jgi:hypothetical protein
VRHASGTSTWNDGAVALLALVWALAWLLLAVRVCLVVERLALAVCRTGQKMAEAGGL